MATWVWIAIAVGALIVIALLAALAIGQRRTSMLRQRFGAEYDRTIQARQGRRAAEADLRGREKQRAQLEIVPLPEAARMRFAGEWRDVQERFVDQPSNAVTAADSLVYRVMGARGYPMHDFDAQADLVSVDYPGVVDDYRVAHGIYLRAQTQQATTEQLREAMLRYRSLFDELLQTSPDDAAAPPAGSANGPSGPARHAGGAEAVDPEKSYPATGQGPR